MQSEIEEVIDSAILWWHERKPISMSLREYLECPTINTRSWREMGLANNVAKYMRNQMKEPLTIMEKKVKKK